MHLRPQSDRYAIQRSKNERTLAWGFVLQQCDMGYAHEGVILAAGEGRGPPMECEEGQTVIYSSRIDTYGTVGGSIDIVDEASIIARVL